MKTLHDGTEVADNTPTVVRDGKRYLTDVVEPIVLKDRPQDDLAKLDTVMPRYAEDIITVVGIEKFPLIVQERVAQKQALRGRLK